MEVIEDTSPKILVPEYNENELNKLVFFIQKMTILFDLHEEDWNDNCIRIIKTWLTEVNELMLTIFYDGNILTACLSFPLSPVYDLTYFLRDPNHIFTIDGFHDEITFGTIHEDIDGTLLAVLEAVYAPIFFNYTGWSENIKSHLCSSLHTFLAYLTGLHFKLAGLTILYIPNEGHKLAPNQVAKDREMLKRLETVAVHWTSQIRLCLKDTDQLVPYELLCPPDEFDFWIYRRKFFYLFFKIFISHARNRTSWV